MRRPVMSSKIPSHSAETSEPDDNGSALERGSRALLALLAADREDRVNPEGTPRPTAVVLADAGLTFSEVALVTGRSKEATRSLVRRWRDRESVKSRGKVLPETPGVELGVSE